MQDFNRVPQNDISWGNTKDMGLDMLINSRKKQLNDMASHSSRSSLRDIDIANGNISNDNDDHENSTKSVDIEPEVIDISNNFKRSSARDDSDSSRSPHAWGREGFGGNNESDSSHSWHESPNNNGFDNNKHQNFSSPSFHQMSDAEIINKKKDMLYEFSRLEKKGVILPRKFTMESSLEEMKMEYDRLKRDRATDASIKFQRRMLMAFVSGVEFMNDKFDPFDVHLTGWSDSVNDDLEDYDEIFEELHEKYRGKSQVAPEVRLLLALGGSGFMFHVQNSMKSNIPGLDQVLKNNPELRRQVAQATAKEMAQESNRTNDGGMMGKMASFVTGFMGPRNNEAQTQRQDQNDDIEYSEPNIEPTRGGRMRQKTQMAPQPSNVSRIKRETIKMSPPNVEDLLNELDLDVSRIELMDSASESSVPDDDASISNLISDTVMNGKKKGKSRKTLTLD